MFVMAYRKDVFDELGLEPPTTFEEMKDAAKTIQDGRDMKYPIALPWLATADIVTAYDAALNSPRHRLRRLRHQDGEPRHARGEAGARGDDRPEALHGPAGHHVRPAEGPAADVQRHRGDADHVLGPDERPHPRDEQQVRRRASPSRPRRRWRRQRDSSTTRLSIDGWSIPVNTELDKDMLFEMIASSVSEEASKASLPAAYPARDGMVSDPAAAYAAAANESIAAAPPAEPYPWTADVSNAITPIIANVISGRSRSTRASRRCRQRSHRRRSQRPSRPWPPGAGRSSRRPAPDRR